MAPRVAGSSGKKDSGIPPGGAASLELSDDQRYSLTEQHRKTYEILMVKKKAANKAVMDHGKIVKADLGAKGLDDIKLLIDLATPEGEAKVKEEIDRQAKVLRWVGVPIGTQAGLFSEEDRTPAADRAFNAGKRAGLAGETAKPPHDPSTEQAKRWLDGHAEGQSILAKGFKPTDPLRGSLPRNDGGLAEQNAKVEDAIKKGTVDQLGSAKSSFKVN